MDCRDNSCFFAKEKTGMRTNGGCRCLRKPLINHKISYLISVAEDILDSWRKDKDPSVTESAYTYELEAALEALNE